MRPIKYRVLNKKTNEITDQIVNINLQHNEVCTWKETYGVDDSYIEYEVLFGSKDEFELMQFTGLLDKNGNEIAQGDILKLKYREKPYIVKNLLEFGWQYHEFVAGSECMEIIGNIHQSPELLEYNK